VSKTRLEAFTDGVIAILITIMVLELRTPHGTTWAALRQDLPVLLAYVLSFVLISIYWNNHHHMLAAVSSVSGMTLWANQHLLFWLSLIPVATAWMSENHFPPIPVAAYGVVLLADRIPKGLELGARDASHGLPSERAKDDGLVDTVQQLRNRLEAREFSDDLLVEKIPIGKFIERVVDLDRRDLAHVAHRLSPYRLSGTPPS